MAGVTVKTYASPTCVLLAFDWPDGANHENFLGFAIRRTPGFGAGKNYLVNKLDFSPIAPNAKPKPSNETPFQKFNWWDSGFADADRGKSFKYEVIPVLGTGPGDLQLQENNKGTAPGHAPRRPRRQDRHLFQSRCRQLAKLPDPEDEAVGGADGMARRWPAERGTGSSA